MASAGFGQLLGPIAGVIAGVGSITAIMAGMKGALDLGSEMVDLSNRTGIAVESLYGLKLAFKDAGVDAEKLGPSVNKMQKALAGAVGGGKEANVLKGMGLDPQALASMDSGQAFAKIGASIAALPNSTERAAASMNLFGKGGAEMLQVFMDPNFKNAGNISNTAKLLGENAGIFDKASDSLGHVGPKLQGLFVGMAAGATGFLDQIANGIDSIDLSGIGQSLGNVAGNFSTDFMDELEKIGSFLAEMLALAFSGDGLIAFGEGLLLAASKMGDGLIKAFKTPLEYLEAGMQHAVELVMEQLGKIPMLGKSLGLRGFAASSFDSTLSEVQSRGNGLANATTGGAENRDIVSSDFKERVARLKETALASLAPVIKATSATEAANAAATDANANRVTGSAPFNPSAIGMAAKQTIVADSLAKVGGGGFSVGPSSDPILEENKRQTSLLAQIAQSIKSPSSNGAASFDGLTA
jgi:hypothetical protein